ncbi:MAG: N-acetyltransferase, partial [Firmicutes bacterium]|nr:N-acetyltransferase [Bacillota bacterium]
TERMQWFEEHQTEAHPLLVAEIMADAEPTNSSSLPQNQDGASTLTQPIVAGYATLSSYRPKAAYDSTAELSLYIAPACRGRGVATALMQAILQAARKCPELHMVVSVITGGNAASIHLHEKFGFTHCGTLHEVGFKHGAYRDVDHYELKV